MLEHPAALITGHVEEYNNHVTVTDPNGTIQKNDFPRSKLYFYHFMLGVCVV